MHIESTSNQRIKETNKLKQKKYRDESGLFLIEGYHLVEEAYKAGILKEVFTTSNINLDVPITYVTEEIIKYLSDVETPQNIIGVCRKLDNNTIGDKVVVLDDIQDPGNLGTIIRSCVAFNIDTIILSDNTVDLYNSKVVRGSQGLLFHSNILIKDIKNIIIELINDGYDIIGTKVDGGTNIKELDFNDKFAVVMGNEGNGVSDDILDLCTKYAHISMNPLCESLNVGVATSIILYELNK